MQSWILAFALAFTAGSALAEDLPPVSANPPGQQNEIPEPAAVPPIPPPDEPMEAATPLDGRWRIADAEPRSGGSGLSISMPPIPAPDLTGKPVPAAPAEGPKTAPAAGEGRKPSAKLDPNGTIHVVQKGDTLWDISNQYLGTPWIWPSVWRDNEEIDNPHLILPGDKIWISANEMRKVSDEEAAALLAAQEAGELDLEEVPAAMAEDAPAVPAPKVRETFHYAEIGTVGLVRKKELKGLAQIVGTIEEAVFIAQGDVVFVDLGEQDAKVGDQLTIFRTSQKVWDPATRHSLGYHTEILGWLEITEVYEESARAVVRMSYADFVPGAYLKEREFVNPQIEIRESPPGVEGQLADLLTHQKYTAGGDVVVLNRGSEDGLRVGSPLEVYRPVSTQWKETWYGREPDIAIPHEVLAQMIVLSVQPHSAMAYVRTAKTELSYGDRFRTIDGPSVEWPEDGLFILPRIKGLIARVPRPDVDMPELDLPDKIGDWNVPRLALPSLDGYDPR